MDFSWLNFDTGSALVFLLILCFLILRYHKQLTLQKLIHIGKIPILYIALWKTRFGLRFMDRVAQKYREAVKLLGYCFIGFGFLGILFISIQILILLFQLIIRPKVASEGVALVLPLTTIPGVGYLSFWHFLISIFVLMLVHEFGHGILARAHDVPVKSSGLGALGLLVPVIPMAFVEPDEKKMAKHSDIAQYSILAAGPMANVMLAVLVALFSSFIFNPIGDRITHPIGVSFLEMMPGYGAEEAGLERGTVITRFNGVETTNYESFIRAAGDPKPGDTVVLGTEKGDYSITTKPAPDNPERGFLGVKGAQNERRINERYASIGPSYFWTKGLLKWLYFLNIAIGLMNLLPIIITDGGRMLKLAFEKTFRNQEKAKRAWSFLASIFLFTLLAAFAVKFFV